MITGANKIVIKGKPIDEQTRCVHYHSPLDIIAIKFKCCNDYYPCYYCHEEQTNHHVEVWKKDEQNTKAILCGICKSEMTIRQYLNCNDQCLFCGSKFNPNCSNHYHFYFEI
ncbi:MAG TPA: CHY zinc finger protein [Chitinophagaceae bacterium]